MTTKYRYVKEGEVLQPGDEWQPIDRSFAKDYGCEPGEWYEVTKAYFGVTLRFGPWGNMPGTIVIRRKIETPSVCKVCKRDVDRGQKCWWCGN